ncbi:MAG: hypothetical protein ACE5GB_10860 [Acidimicrobiales bacterium]
MSSAVVFLLVALGAAVVGSSLLWLVQRSPRRDSTDYRDQLRAIAPRDARRQVDQPSGVVRLDPPGRSGPPDEEES